MRLATATAAALLMLGAQAAYANQYVGTITEIRADGRTFTLDDGNVYKLDTNTPQSSKAILANEKVGQKVRVTYEASTLRPGLTGARRRSSILGPDRRRPGTLWKGLSPRGGSCGRGVPCWCR
jgi:hypothetical protein